MDAARGEVARVRDKHNELRVQVAEATAPRRQFAVVVRAFDDGIGFRYEVSDSGGLRDFEMTEELTEFTFADDGRAWWIPSYKPRPDRYEDLYSSSPVSNWTRPHTAHRRAPSGVPPSSTGRSRGLRGENLAGVRKRDAARALARGGRREGARPRALVTPCGRSSLPTARRPSRRRWLGSS